MTTVIPVHVAHYSMQYSDTAPQMRSDAIKIFTRGYDWITGTEAGEAPLKGILIGAAELHGYTFFSYKSNWIAVKKSFMVKGSYSATGETVFNNDFVVGPGHDLNVVRVHFKHPTLGKITILGSHYATKGKPDGKTPLERRNLTPNKVLAKAIGRLTEKFGAGRALVFYGGDQNIVDRDNDTFFGFPLTSAWDELNHYENTGHGNIDVIASYDRDARVAAQYIRALDDRELPMNTDHFPVEAGFLIRTLR